MVSSRAPAGWAFFLEDLKTCLLWSEGSGRYLISSPAAGQVVPALEVRYISEAGMKPGV